MKVMLTGGGTGGHIYPAIAIAERLMATDKNTVCEYVGAKRGKEKDIVPGTGLPFKQIDVAPLNKKISVATIKAIVETVQGHIQAYHLIKAFKPNVIIGTGGYVTGPVVLMGALMGVPCAIHEQNAFPGMANKILSRFVDRVLLTFEEARPYFKYQDKISYTGLPIRDAFFSVNRKEARQKLGVSDDEMMMLVVGGSNGAQKINEVMCELYEKLQNETRIKTFHMSGQRYYEALKNRFKEDDAINVSNTVLLEYIEDMPLYLAAADLVISRAGASTITEIIASKTPSIIIPSPNVANNHQFHNAKVIDKNGMGLVIEERDLTTDLMHHTVLDLLDQPVKREIMAKNCEKVDVASALKRITETVRMIAKD